MAERNYPEDEFDRLALNRTVVGHREPESNRIWWLAVLAIVVLAPVAGWAFVHLGGADSTAENKWPTQSATPQQLPSPDATGKAEDEAEDGDTKDEAAAGDAAADKASEPSEKESEEATPSPSASQTPSSGADKATEVRLLNGSRVNGLAATKQQALAGAGFTNVVAGNYAGGAAPQTSTIYYATEADEATAKEVGSSLGISNIQFSPQSVVGGKGIVVVLRSDSAR